MKKEMTSTSAFRASDLCLLPSDLLSVSNTPASLRVRGVVAAIGLERQARRRLCKEEEDDQRSAFRVSDF